MIKQGTLYAAVINFINSHNIGDVYTSVEFKAALEDITRRHRQHLKYNGQWYRCRTYQTYLRRLGLIKNIQRGKWEIVYHVPSWMTLYALETIMGYKNYTPKENRGENGRWFTTYVLRDPAFCDETRERLKIYKQRIDKDGVEETCLVKPNPVMIDDIVEGTVFVYDSAPEQYTVTEVLEDACWIPFKLSWIDHIDKTLIYSNYSMQPKTPKKTKSVTRELKPGTKYAKCIKTNSYKHYIKGKYYEVLDVDNDGYPDSIINEDGDQWFLINNKNSFERALFTQPAPKPAPKPTAPVPPVIKKIDNPFKPGDKVRLVTKESKIYDQSIQFTTYAGLMVGEVYTVLRLDDNGIPEKWGGQSFLCLKDHHHLHPCDIFELHNVVVPIGWKIGDKIMISAAQPIYTIESFTDSTQSRINLTWESESLNKKMSLTYDVETVNMCVARRVSDNWKWKVQSAAVTSSAPVTDLRAAGRMEQFLSELRSLIAKYEQG